MDKQNSSGGNDYRSRFEKSSGGSLRDPSSGTYRSREDYYERHSEPGEIDRPFTRRMQQEARKAALAPEPEHKKEKPVRKKKKRDPEKRINRKYILGGIVGAILLALICIIIFGEHGTHHAMPKITPPETQEESNGE